VFQCPLFKQAIASIKGAVPHLRKALTNVSDLMVWHKVQKSLTLLAGESYRLK